MAIKPLFTKLRRIVRDLSVKLNKDIELEMEGEETEADRSMVEALGDPLVHIVRNAMDHGIEDKSEREKSQKPKKARLKIAARQSGGDVVIEVSDDGRGIDRKKIIAKAVKSGLAPSEEALAHMPDEDIFAFLFKSGFSTAEKVTDLSGRGVGLDVVRKNIEKLKGKVGIESVLGKGSKFSIKLPLTAAITDGVLVTRAGVKFILPTHSIVEMIRSSEVEISRTEGEQKIVRVRDEVFPYVEARALFFSALKIQQSLNGGDGAVSVPAQNSAAAARHSIVAILEVAEKKLALPIDEVLDLNQFVIKPLGLDEGAARGFAGGAVLGNGSVALVMDVDALPTL